MSESDEQFAILLAAAGHGDESAIARLVERYELKVRVVARVLLGRALRTYVDSVDLVQSVHRSLILGLRNHKFHFTTPEQLIALATTLVRRKVARQWRQAQRQRHLISGPVRRENLPDVLASLSDSRDDPAAAAQFNDQLDHLCRNLDPAERRMLEMRLQGYTAVEVAEKLGMHAVAVRVRWTRLRRFLQDHGVVVDWL